MRARPGYVGGEKTPKQSRSHVPLRCAGDPHEPGPDADRGRAVGAWEVVNPKGIRCLEPGNST